MEIGSLFGLHPIWNKLMFHLYYSLTSSTRYPYRKIQKSWSSQNEAMTIGDIVKQLKK